MRFYIVQGPQRMSVVPYVSDGSRIVDGPFDTRDEAFSEMLYLEKRADKRRSILGAIGITFVFAMVVLGGPLVEALL